MRKEIFVSLAFLFLLLSPTCFSEAAEKRLGEKIRLSEETRNDFDGYVGMRLTVGAREMIVSEIGRYFHKENSGSHRLAIFDSDGQELTATSVTMKKELADPSGFQFGKPEKTIVLASGETYFVVSQEHSGGDFWCGREHLSQIPDTEDAKITGVYRTGNNWMRYGIKGSVYGPLMLKYTLGKAGNHPIDFSYRNIKKGQRDIPYGYLLNSRFWAINTYLAPDVRKLSGWDVDTSGGTFRHQGLNEGSFTGKFFDWFRLEDTSPNAPVSMKHRLARQEKGNLVLEYRMKPDPPTQKGVCVVLGDGEKEATRYEAPEFEREFGVKVVVDLDNKRTNTYLNGSLILENQALPSGISGIDNVQITTGKESTGHVYLTPVEIHKGFLVNERFQTSATGKVPDDWIAEDSQEKISVETISSAALPDIYSMKFDNRESGKALSLKKQFPNENPSLVTRVSFLLPEKRDGVRFLLKSSDDIVWEFCTINGNICTLLSDGSFQPLIENYRRNLWYAIKITSDTTRKTSDISVNGKTVSTGCQNIRSNGFADSFSVETPKDKTILWIDDIQIYPFFDYPADYVRKPQKVSSENTLVGIQSCNLWREGMGYSGWQWISDDNAGDRVPLLGYYDEGNPEVTDWQILWQAEHGIDFELHCWYRSDNAVGFPIKRTPYDHEIIDGLFNARYKSLKKFMIMWESNLFGYTNTEDFRQNIVPYWIEYLFKDPSYLKINNKPVLSIYFNTLSKFSDPKAELDFLREECVKAGFDGVIIWHEDRTNNKESLKLMRKQGVDYVYAYTWGGSFPVGGKHQQDANRRQRDIVAEIDGLGMIPSVGLGFDVKAWQNQSGLDNIMTPKQYREMLFWLRDEFLKTVPEEELGRKIVLIGNWNEFGEGHFLMPSTYEGFRVIEAIREVFTGIKNGEKTVPTETQQRRIDVLYPFDWK